MIYRLRWSSLRQLWGSLRGRVRLLRGLTPCFYENIQLYLAVGVVLEDRLAPVSARSHVVERPFEFGSRQTGHLETLSVKKAKGKTSPSGFVTCAFYSRMVIVMNLFGHAIGSSVP